jgi:hypothetical protein
VAYYLPQELAQSVVLPVFEAQDRTDYGFLLVHRGSFSPELASVVRRL